MPRTFGIKIEESEHGVWFATSETEPTMFLACVGLDELLSKLPELLRRLVTPVVRETI